MTNENVSHGLYRFFVSSSIVSVCEIELCERVPHMVIGDSVDTSYQIKFDCTARRKRKHYEKMKIGDGAMVCKRTAHVFCLDFQLQTIHHF